MTDRTLKVSNISLIIIRDLPMAYLPNLRSRSLHPGNKTKFLF